MSAILFKNIFSETAEYDDAAVFWWAKSTEQGNIEAQFFLARCCEEGVGTERDYSKAKYWYIRAAERGNKQALRWLAVQRG